MSEQTVAAQRREAEAYRLRAVAVAAADAARGDLAAATERADRLVAAGNAMAELLEETGSPGAWYIPESGTEVYIAGCHARCQAHGASDRWRALVGAGDVNPQTDAAADPC